MGLLVGRGVAFAEEWPPGEESMDEMKELCLSACAVSVAGIEDDRGNLFGYDSWPGKDSPIRGNIGIAEPLSDYGAQQTFAYGTTVRTYCIPCGMLRIEVFGTGELAQQGLLRHLWAIEPASVPPRLRTDDFPSADVAFGQEARSGDGSTCGLGLHVAYTRANVFVLLEAPVSVALALAARIDTDLQRTPIWAPGDPRPSLQLTDLLYVGASLQHELGYKSWPGKDSPIRENIQICTASFSYYGLLIPEIQGRTDVKFTMPGRECLRMQTHPTVAEAHKHLAWSLTAYQRGLPPRLTEEDFPAADVAFAFDFGERPELRVHYVRANVYVEIRASASAVLALADKIDADIQGASLWSPGDPEPTLSFSKSAHTAIDVATWGIVKARHSVP